MTPCDACGRPPELVVWGWNFRDGEPLTITFYDDGRVLGIPITTRAYQDGPVVGYFATSISFSFPLQGQFTASVSEPDQNGYTWWAAAPPVTC